MIQFIKKIIQNQYL